MDFTYRLFDFEDTSQLEEMYEACFGIIPNSRYFSWKYKQNPAGPAVGYVAHSNNQIAGFYGVIPERFLINGEMAITYQSMDTMTHPDFQRKGLFTKLANLTYQHIEQRDGRINLLGFPGETSYPGFIKKLNWSTLKEFQYLFINELLFRVKTLTSKVSNLKAIPIISFNEEFDLYFEKPNTIEKPITKLIDQKLANWLFFDSPLMQYSTLKIMDGDTIIGFVTYYMDEKNRAMLRCINCKIATSIINLLKTVLIYLFCEIKVSYVYTFHSTAEFIGKGLRASGFVMNPLSKGPFSYKTPMIVYGSKIVNGINYYDVENWDIQPYLRDY